MSASAGARDVTVAAAILESAIAECVAHARSSRSSVRRLEDDPQFAGSDDVSTQVPSQTAFGDAQAPGASAFMLPSVSPPPSLEAPPSDSSGVVPGETLSPTHATTMTAKTANAAAAIAGRPALRGMLAARSLRGEVVRHRDPAVGVHDDPDAQPPRALRQDVVVVTTARALVHHSLEEAGDQLLLVRGRIGRGS